MGQSSSALARWFECDLIYEDYEEKPEKPDNIDVSQLDEKQISVKSLGKKEDQLNNMNKAKMENDSIAYKQVQVISDFDSLIEDKQNKTTLVNMTLQNEGKIIEEGDLEQGSQLVSNQLDNSNQINQSQLYASPEKIAKEIDQKLLITTDEHRLVSGAKLIDQESNNSIAENEKSNNMLLDNSLDDQLGNSRTQQIETNPRKSQTKTKKKGKKKLVSQMETTANQANNNGTAETQTASNILNLNKNQENISLNVIQIDQNGNTTDGKLANIGVIGNEGIINDEMRQQQISTNAVEDTAAIEKQSSQSEMKKQVSVKELKLNATQKDIAVNQQQSQSELQNIDLVKPELAQISQINETLNEVTKDQNAKESTTPSKIYVKRNQIQTNEDSNLQNNLDLDYLIQPENQDSQKQDIPLSQFISGEQESNKQQDNNIANNLLQLEGDELVGVQEQPQVVPEKTQGKKKKKNGAGSKKKQTAANIEVIQQQKQLLDNKQSQESLEKVNIEQVNAQQVNAQQVNAEQVNAETQKKDAIQKAQLKELEIDTNQIEQRQYSTIPNDNSIEFKTPMAQVNNLDLLKVIQNNTEGANNQEQDYEVYSPTLMKQNEISNSQILKEKFQLHAQKLEKRDLSTRHLVQSMGNTMNQQNQLNVLGVQNLVEGENSQLKVIQDKQNEENNSEQDQDNKLGLDLEQMMAQQCGVIGEEVVPEVKKPKKKKKVKKKKKKVAVIEDNSNAFDLIQQIQ